MVSVRFILCYVVVSWPHTYMYNWSCIYGAQMYNEKKTSRRYGNGFLDGD